MIKKGFADEKVITLRKLYQQMNRSYDFKKEIAIHDEYYRFLPQRLLNNSVEIMLPESFIDMSENIRDKKYLSLDSRAEVKTSLRFTENFIFQMEEKADDDLDATAKMIFDTINTNLPQTVFYDGGKSVTDENLSILWQEYKSFASDGEIYNFMFLFASSSHIFISTFNSIFTDYSDWKPCLLEIIKTVKLLNET